VAGLVALLKSLIALLAGFIALLVGQVALVAGLVALLESLRTFVLHAPQVVLQREDLFGEGHGVTLAEQLLDSCRQLQLPAGVAAVASM
jgi:ABC-type branched-subunit amino acid transport system permease subunit